MKFIVELDDRCARDLERVAPAKKRMRAEFVRLAVRRAIDLAMDANTAKAYAARPLIGELTRGDLDGWDDTNELSEPPEQLKTLGKPPARSVARHKKAA